MINYLNGNKSSFLKELKHILGKRKFSQKNLDKKVFKIIKNVKKNKDRALILYEKKFSNIKKSSTVNFKFSKKEIKEVIRRLDYNTKKSIDLAFSRIFKFHKNQKLKNFKYSDKFKNSISYRSVPIDRVGVYVPGGTASYPSTVLMNCIPAIIAGVKEIYMTTPALDKKKINPGVIYAASKCKVKEIYKFGGAQAIAALAYGTKNIQKVNKIVGPGNAFVALAKKEVFGDTGIDMIAGPSEVTIVADKNANPSWVAADLIAQAEHDIMAQSILLSDNLNLINNVKKNLKNQINLLPKKKIIEKSLKKFGYLIFIKNKKKLLEALNEIAPEHLEINIKRPNKILKGIKNAGSIFLGKYSAEAIGDYLAGPNHVLPTSGSAKFASGLSVYDFIKRYSLIKISKTGIERLGASVINLAKYENLDGHANSIKLRLNGK